MHCYHPPFSKRAEAELLAAISPHTIDHVYGLAVAAASVPHEFHARVVFGVLNGPYDAQHVNDAAVLLAMLFKHAEADLHHDPALVVPDPDDLEACAAWATAYLHVVVASEALHPWQSLTVTRAVVALSLVASQVPGCEKLAAWLPVITERLYEAWKTEASQAMQQPALAAAAC